MKTKQFEQSLHDGKGALPVQYLNDLIDRKFISHNVRNPGPASLDLTLGEEIYEIQHFLPPRKNEEVFSLLKAMGARKHKSNVLMPGKQYMILHEERFVLPRILYGYANPKSTTGRAFVHARVIADGVDLRDHMPREFRGKIWSYVVPKIFPVSYEPNIDSMNQMRIFRNDARLTEFEIQSMQIASSAAKDEYGKFIQPKASWIRGGNHGYMIFTADTNGIDGIAGYEAIKAKEPLPIGAVKTIDPKKYFKPLSTKGIMKLIPDKYYILSTRERVSIPANYAAEVKAIDERYGEFRTHFAGFFDPGFGYDPSDPLFGNTMTLEVKVFENTSLRHGQPIGCLQFEHMLEIPESLYGQTGSNYHSQIGAKLGKQFI